MRARSSARWLAETPDILQAYGDIISDQQSRGFVEQVQATLSLLTHNVHYIPHHPVRKKSLTTLIRIVYSCGCQETHTAKFKWLLYDWTTISKWYMWYTTLLLHTQIWILNWHWESFPICYFAQDWQRLYQFPVTIWSHQSRQWYQYLCFKVVLFRSVSSPFMLNATFHYHLCIFLAPKVADIETNLYLDNVISGCDFETDAVNNYYCNPSRSIMGQAKFNLWLWASNSTAVQSLAQANNAAERDNTTEVLSLLWHATSDTLSLAYWITAGDYLVTKQKILQDSLYIFYPFGLIIHVTIQAKILLQKLWKAHIDWDEPLQKSFQSRWIEIIQEIRKATELVIPRQYLTAI